MLGEERSLWFSRRYHILAGFAFSFYPSCIGQDRLEQPRYRATVSGQLPDETPVSPGRCSFFQIDVIEPQAVREDLLARFDAPGVLLRVPDRFR
jgi:hypothetical protein